MCSPMDMQCHVSSAVQSAANGMIANLERSATDFFSTVLNSLATFWVKPKTPLELATVSADGQTWTETKTVAFLQDKTLALTLTIFTLAIVIAGIRMAWEQRAKPLQELLKAIMTFVVVCGAGTAMMQILIAWSDEFAVSVVTDALGGDSFMEVMRNTITNGSETGSSLLTAHTSWMLMLLLSQTAAFASLIQIVLMLIRSAMLVLLGSTLPLAAAATNTEVGKAWFKKYCAWTLGFIAYKPAAALIYAAAIKLKQEMIFDEGSSGLLQQLTGVMMMLLALLALPALLRLAVPVTAAVSGGSAGMGSAGPEIGSLASGAINVGPASQGGGAGASAGAGGGASGAAASGGGATGAATAGASAGAAALGPAGVAVAAGRKAAGAFAGAAAHSAGEAGGGSSGASSPRSGGPMRSARGGGGRSRSSSMSTPPPPPPKVTAGATAGDDGPAGSW